MKNVLIASVLAAISMSAKAGSATAHEAAQLFANEVNGRVVNCVAQADGVTSCRVAEYTTRSTVITYQLACTFGSSGHFCFETNRFESNY